MNPILAMVTAAALTLAGFPAFAEPLAPSPAGPAMTNGWPMPPQVFAPDALPRVAGRAAERSVGAGPGTTR